MAMSGGVGLGVWKGSPKLLTVNFTQPVGRVGRLNPGTPVVAERVNVRVLSAAAGPTVMAGAFRSVLGSDVRAFTISPTVILPLWLGSLRKALIPALMLPLPTRLT